MGVMENVLLTIRFYSVIHCKLFLKSTPKLAILHDVNKKSYRPITFLTYDVEG